MSGTPSADKIEQVAFGFIASEVLFSAIELGLFTELAKGSLELNESFLLTSRFFLGC